MKHSGVDAAVIQSPLTELLGMDRRAAWATGLFAAAATAFAVYWFFHSAPPMALTLAAGRKDSLFERQAKAYAKVLERSGVRVKVADSEGSIENLKRLAEPRGPDAAFVVSGVADSGQTAELVSLGAVNHQPLFIFYRLPRPIGVLSALKGRRLAVGPDGSGTRKIALALLAANGIAPGGSTELSGVEAQTATRELLAGKLDAVFLMGDSAPVEVLKELLHDKAVRLFSFEQADAYVKRFNYLNKIPLARGAIDLGEDIPPSDVILVGPTVELAARRSLDPALAELLIEAAKEVSGGPGIFRQRGEFPSPEARDFTLSPAAAHYYKAGKSFFNRHLPFWIASLIDRILVSFVPLLVVLIPGLKLIPGALRWRINLLLYRWYRMLLKVEREVFVGQDEERKPAILAELDRIEKEVNRMKVPVPFATQFYDLRGHINFVRAQLK